MISKIIKMNEELVGELKFIYAPSIIAAIHADAESLVKKCIEDGLLIMDNVPSKYMIDDVEMDVIYVKEGLYEVFFFIKEEFWSFAKVAVTTY